jgi:hypothetical protein
VLWVDVVQLRKLSVKKLVAQMQFASTATNYARAVQYLFHGDEKK